MLVECELTCACNVAMNREKGGRPNQFVDKCLKEFGWLQTRGSGHNLLMICKDCTKAGKKNGFTSGYKNFHFNFFLRGGSQRFRDPPKMLGDPNLTGYVAPRTQFEKSQCHPCIANGFSLSIYWRHVTSNLHKTDTSQWRIQTFR